MGDKYYKSIDSVSAIPLAINKIGLYLKKS